MNFLTENKIEQYADLLTRIEEIATASEQAGDSLKAVSYTHLITTMKLPVCQKRAKEKRRNPATLQSLYADKNEGTLFPRPVVVGFLYAFCSSRHDF